MKAKVVIVTLVTFAVVFFFGCQGNVPNWPKNVLSNIFVPKEASVDKYYTMQGTYQVKYSVKEPFPGSRYLDNMVENMSARGWRRLEEDFLNPGLKHSWARNGTIEMKFGAWAEGRSKRVYLWMEDWEDAKKNIIRYDIKYIGHEDTKGHIKIDKSSTVIVIYIPSEHHPDPSEWAEHAKAMERKTKEESAKERRRFMRSTGP